MKIPVDLTYPNPQQPRTRFDPEYIKGLAHSIKEHGLQSPILVEDNGDGTYTLVDGECRLRAHKLAGLKTIEATVRPQTNHSGKQRLVDAMIANVARDNMSPVDEGQGYRTMRELGMSVKEISMAVGRNETRVRNLMRITDLDRPIQMLIADGKFPHDVGAVNALLSIPDSLKRIEMAKRLAARGATVKVVVKSCERYLEEKQQARKARMKIPALEVAKVTEKPKEWDALYQINRVPPWQKFVEAVMDTCDNCPLRPIASDATCRDCPVVDMCRRLMKEVTV